MYFFSCIQNECHIIQHWEQCPEGPTRSGMSEQDNDDKSCSEQRQRLMRGRPGRQITFSCTRTHHVWSSIPGAGAGFSVNWGRTREGVGNWLLKEVNGRAQLLTKATKWKRSRKGNFRTQMKAMSTQILQVRQRKVLLFEWEICNYRGS
jgi:hypothetical protein